MGQASGTVVVIHGDDSGGSGRGEAVAEQLAKAGWSPSLVGLRDHMDSPELERVLPLLEAAEVPDNLPAFRRWAGRVGRYSFYWRG